MEIQESPKKHRGPIIMPLYPLEKIRGVPLPANVDPIIAVNFAANKGPHVRCLTPYLPLPPSPLSHPWLYTQQEIDSYREKLAVTEEISDQAPPILEGGQIQDGNNNEEGCDGDMGVTRQVGAFSLTS